MGNFWASRMSLRLGLAISLALVLACTPGEQQQLQRQAEEVARREIERQSEQIKQELQKQAQSAAGQARQKTEEEARKLIQQTTDSVKADAAQRIATIQAELGYNRPDPGSILGPFAAGTMMTITHDYNNPLPGKECPIGVAAPDHCQNQKYALDIVPANGLGREILAPVDGEVTLILDGPKDPQCVLMKITGNLNITICHFDSYTVKVGDRMVRGQLLGTRGTPHVHLSLDSRYDASGAQKPNRDQWTPVPFAGPYAIEGLELPARGDAAQLYYRNKSFVSTNTRR